MAGEEYFRDRDRRRDQSVAGERLLEKLAVRTQSLKRQPTFLEKLQYIYATDREQAIRQILDRGRPRRRHGR